MNCYWKPFLGSLFSLFISGSLLPAFAQETQISQTFSEQQKQEIQEIIKDYLIKNPAVLIEANEAVQEERERRQQIQRVETEKNIAANPFNILVGNPAGDVTIIEFFDYNCGYCRKTLADIQTVAKSDPNVKFLIHDYPVLGSRSIDASRVSLAVRLQADDKKMFEFHTKLMESKSAIDADSAKEAAKAVGIDMQKLEADMNGDVITAALEKSQQMGRQIGLQGTPAFLIAGEIIPGAVGPDTLKEFIKNVRTCGKLICP